MKKFKNMIVAFVLCIALGFTSISFAVEPKISSTDSHWAKEFINHLKSQNYVCDYQDEIFKSNENVTVVESLFVILKSIDSFVPESANGGHEGAIVAAMGSMVINRNEFTDYNRPITRAELCKIIAKALKQQPKEGNTNFIDDNTIPNEYKGYIKVVNELKLMNGYTDKSFKPNGKVTRGEMCIIATKMMEAKRQLSLVNRKIEKRLPITSSAKYENPKNYKELKENLESLKVYPYSTSKKDYDMVDLDQITNNINNLGITDIYGVISMEFPNYKYELKQLEFENNIYNQLYCDQFLEEDYRNGLLIKDNEIIENIYEMKTNNGPRGYYNMGKVGVLEQADYIILYRYAKYYFNSSDLKYPNYDKVAILFKNPFKKDTVITQSSKINDK